MKMLVLGSEGFLGAAVVRQARDRGHEVQTLGGAAPTRKAVAAAAEGSDCVVDAAPLPDGDFRRPGPLLESGLTRARALLGGAADAGVRRVVRVGSQRSVGSTVDPGVGCRPEEWTLARSDARVLAHVETELWCRAQAQRRGLDLIRVLPTTVLGPGSTDPARDLALVRAYGRWRLGLFAHGGLNVIDVRDAAAAVVTAAERGRPGARYLVGGHDLSYKALYVAMAGALGRRHLHVAFPRWVGLMVGAVVEMAARLLGRSAAFDRNAADLRFGRYAYVQPPDAPDRLAAARPIGETMEASVADLRAAGLLA